MAFEGHRLLGDDQEETSLTKKHAIVISVAATVVIVLVLGIGLGVGLNAKKIFPGEKSVATIMENNNILGHLSEFEGWKTRAPGTPGSAASITYLSNLLTSYGCIVSNQTFDMPVWTQNALPTLTLSNPSGPLTLAHGIDFVQADYGGPTQSITFGKTFYTSGSGCNLTDFTGMPAGSVVLMDAGYRLNQCLMATKAQNAAQAGASAIIMRVDQIIGRAAMLPLMSYPWYIGMPAGSPIPVLITSYTMGTVIFNSQSDPTFNVSLSTNSTQVTVSVTNTFCDTPQGDASKMIVLGAHYDSVPEGPGVNDNGSGSASLIEVVRAWFQYFPDRNDSRVVNKVRFAWWAAEELGLIGSFNWVKYAYDTGYLNNVILGMNCDMLGSPNGYPQIHGLSVSSFQINSSLVNGTNYLSDVLAKSMESSLGGNTPLWNYTAFAPNSDYWPFLAYGVPAGGLATGAADEITPELAARYGKLLINVQEDPCYHQACDTTASISMDLVATMSRTAGYAIQQLATTANLALLVNSYQSSSAAFTSHVHRGAPDNLADMLLEHRLSKL